MGNIDLGDIDRDIRGGVIVQRDMVQEGNDGDISGGILSGGTLSMGDIVRGILTGILAGDIVLGDIDGW